MMRSRYSICCTQVSEMDFVVCEVSVLTFEHNRGGSQCLSECAWLGTSGSGLQVQHLFEYCKGVKQ